MKILFCNIAYMNLYTGNIDEDIPQGGGAWVKAHKDAHEKWNFLNVNGNCYGFVMNKSDQFHIERMQGVSSQDAIAEDATVVWCALKPSGDTVIVGWYEHATVSRYYQSSMGTPFGLSRDYFVWAKAEDCYLLPEEDRSYVIGRASTDGKGRGFGQSNFWYADSEYAKENIVPDVLTYLSGNKYLRINKTNASFSAPSNVTIPLSEEEDALASEYFDGNEYAKFLPLGYRAFHANPTGDNAYFIATALKALHQYTEAVTWYRKVIEMEGDSWDATSNLPYLLMECGDFDAAIKVATQLLALPEAEAEEVKHEIYSILADNYHIIGNVVEAVSWLEKIINESSDDELVAHTKQTRAMWLEG